MCSKNNKLTVYENNLLNVELINFIINSKNILTNKVKNKLIFEWYKTKWFVKKNLASLSERENHDYPGRLDALSVYINQEKIWPLNTRIPWAYFVALKLGLRPESEKTWVLLHPANISLNMYQANLEIISNQTLDNMRIEILKKSIFKLGGEIIIYPEANIYLVKLPKIFSEMQSHFPHQTSQLSSHQFSSSDKVSKLWRTCMTEVEMEWYQLNSNESGVNSMWAWGWGSMPSSLEYNSKFKSQNNEEVFEDDKITSLMINGLIAWLENKTENRFNFNVSKKTPFVEFNLSSLQNYAKGNKKKEYQKEILLSVHDFTNTLSIFNKNIEADVTNTSNFIYSNEFILTQKKESAVSKPTKLLLNLKSFLYSL